MIFSNLNRSKDYEYNFNLKINSEPIYQSHKERFLGVIMDDKLSWSEHRAAIGMKVSRNAGIFFRARHMFNIPTLKTLYYSFIQSHLVYCSSIWGTGSKNSLRSIFVAQKKAVRAISFTKLYSKDDTTHEYSYGHTKSLFKSLELLTVHNLILVQVLSQMHKIYNLLAPTYTRSLFVAHQPPIPEQSHELHWPDSTLTKKDIKSENIIQSNKVDYKYFDIPTCRLAKQRQSVVYLGPLLYNYTCSKVQNNIDDRYTLHKFSPTSFSFNIKRYLLTIQALGLPDQWEAQNTPMYTTSTSMIITRSQIAPEKP